MIDLTRFEILTFDCYGTLIDWERGILHALRPRLAAHGVIANDEDLLARFASLESQAEAGSFQPYREVLRQVARGVAEAYGFDPAPADVDVLVRSLPSWPPFGDTVAALQAFRPRYRLGVISNIDDALFAPSADLLQVPFDWVITAEQARSYKPSRRNFEVALERIGRPVEGILHVAQSLFHDIAPARELGLSTVWVNRRHDRKGSGATPPASARPDLEVPDLRTLVGLMGLA